MIEIQLRDPFKWTDFYTVFLEKRGSSLLSSSSLVWNESFLEDFLEELKNKIFLVSSVMTSGVFPTNRCFKNITANYDH